MKKRLFPTFVICCGLILSTAAKPGYGQSIGTPDIIEPQGDAGCGTAGERIARTLHPSLPHRCCPGLVPRIEDSSYSICEARTDRSSSGCQGDADCRAAGCSSTICLPKGAGNGFSTCEWREEYECLKQTSCGCVNGSCRWKENEQYRRCMERVRQ